NYVVGGTVGTLFATWCARNTLFQPEWGWRRAFWGPALALGLIGILYITMIRNRPAHAGLPEIAEDDAPAEPGLRTDEAIRVSAVREALAQSAVWITGIMYFFVKLTRYALLFWLPTYMVEHL